MILWAMLFVLFFVTMIILVVDAVIEEEPSYLPMAFLCFLAVIFLALMIQPDCVTTSAYTEQIEGETFLVTKYQCETVEGDIYDDVRIEKIEVFDEDR